MIFRGQGLGFFGRMALPKAAIGFPKAAAIDGNLLG